MAPPITTPRPSSTRSMRRHQRQNPPPTQRQSRRRRRDRSSRRRPFPLPLRLARSRPARTPRFRRRCCSSGTSRTMTATAAWSPIPTLTSTRPSHASCCRTSWPCARQATANQHRTVLRGSSSSTPPATGSTGSTPATWRRPRQRACTASPTEARRVRASPAATSTRSSSDRFPVSQSPKTTSWRSFPTVMVSAIKSPRSDGSAGTSPTR